jgi:CheY-like chemotaxis protein
MLTIEGFAAGPRRIKGADDMPRILLVEDNEENRDALSRRLERRGYEVVIAIDGEHGLAMARADAPDLILLDMNLPEMDGWEVARALRAAEATRGIPIIALTAHAMSGDREKALGAGCDEYHTKPAQLPRLLAQMEELLKRGGTR